MRLLSSIPKEVQHEFGDVSTGNGNVLDGGADDISVRDGDSICVCCQRLVQVTAGKTYG